MKILLIEDDPSNIELMRLRLEALECAVAVATTANEGMDKAHREQPDLILLDLKLDHDPNAGVDLVKRLQADPETKDIPVVIHSIFVTHPAEATEALPVAKGYLPKPFRFLDLKHMVEEFKAARLK